MFLFALSVLPSIAIISFIYNRKYKGQKPLRFLFKLFIYGCLVTIPIVLVEVFATGYLFLNASHENMPDLVYLFFETFFCVALTEEGFKYLVFFTQIKKSPIYNGIYDSIIYSVLVSLGFATVENMLYISDLGVKTAVIRAVTAVPCHAILGVTMGYYMGLSMFAKSKTKKVLYASLSLVVPVLLHGVYNFLVLSSNELFLFLFIPFMVYLYVSGTQKANILAKMDFYQKRMEDQQFYQAITDNPYRTYVSNRADQNRPKVNYDLLNNPLKPKPPKN